MESLCSGTAFEAAGRLRLCGGQRAALELGKDTGPKLHYSREIRGAKRPLIFANTKGNSDPLQQLRPKWSAHS